MEVNKMSKCKEKICLPKDEIIDEHEHLVHVLEHPSTSDIKGEAKEQKKELAEYKKTKKLGKSIKEFFNASKEDASSLGDLKSFLEKARRRLSDEEEDPDETPESTEGMREFDPDEESGDNADKWLEENDPKKEDDDEQPKEYDEYGPDDDEESHQRMF